MRVFERRATVADLVFDPIDGAAQDRGLRGPRPRPLDPVEWTLTDVLSGGGGLPPPPFGLVTVPNRGGFDLFFGEVKLSSGSVVRQGALPAGTYRVRAAARMHVPRQLDITVPVPGSPLGPVPDTHPPVVPSPNAVTFLLGPAPSYPFPHENARGPSFGPTLLRGVVEDGGGVAQEGVAIRVAAPAVGPDWRTPLLQQPTFTDSSGQWVLSFPDGLFTNEPVPLSPPATLSVNLEIDPGGAAKLVNIGVVMGQEHKGGALKVQL